ncbi:MAG: hypothetical protein A2091_12180 [Desulfuromonadales bacterium GWD2_61_12]|nr:MAG: hypothetical protein A2091_12180 [Desulfuromonadales bacterium GWD2_61_12]
MPAPEDQLITGQQLLQSVALRYASQHGLHPDKIEWTCPSGDEWWLQVTTAEHSVKVAFSADEIIDFAAGGEGASSSKVKIRNAFAGLAM